MVAVPRRAPADLTTSQALLAYASDGFLIATAMRPHAGVGQAQAHVSISTTVLSQTITFHEPFDAGQWLLLAHEAPTPAEAAATAGPTSSPRTAGWSRRYVQENMIRGLPRGSGPRRRAALEALTPAAGRHPSVGDRVLDG